MSECWVWIDTVKKLDEAGNDILNSSTLCVDTEYDSFRYFRELLCLLQIKTDKRTYLFDPLNKSIDFSFLKEVFANVDTVKVMHAGDNDIRILKRDYGFEFKNIFDTQRAAFILGQSHLSLAALVGNFLGIEFEKKKSMQRSRWENRPLTPEQLNYAVLDTKYLKDLYYRLDMELRQSGLSEKAKEAFSNIAGATWNEKICDPLGYKKIKGYHLLSVHQKQFLKKLYYWRFRKAIITNEAQFMILSDQNLLDISRIGISSFEALCSTSIISPEKAELYGREIIATVREQSV